MKDYPEIELKINEPGTSVQIYPTQVIPQVKRRLKLISGEMSWDELLVLLDLKDSKHFFKTYLSPALDAKYIARTKDKRNDPNQKTVSPKKEKSY